MTQTPDDRPDPLDDSSLTPSEPPPAHGDPLAGPPPQGGQVPPPPPPPPGYDPTQQQPPYDQGYQQGYQQPQYDQGQAAYPQPGYPQPGYQQPAYQQGQPGAPYGIHPGTGIPYSDKSKLVAGLLQIFISGVGRMYIGQVGLGVTQLLVAIFTCGIGAIWSVVDGIIILTKDDARDAQGLILKS